MEFSSLTVLERRTVCPKQHCFQWVYPGGAADMSGKPHASLTKSFQDGKWVSFPEGGCTCTWGECRRAGGSGTEDFYEPCEPELDKAGLPHDFFLARQ